MAKEKVKKEKPVNDHPNKIGIKEAAGYTIAEAGNMFNLTYISSFLKIFLTDDCTFSKVGLVKAAIGE